MMVPAFILAFPLSGSPYQVMSPQIAVAILSIAAYLLYVSICSPGLRLVIQNRVFRVTRALFAHRLGLTRLSKLPIDACSKSVNWRQLPSCYPILLALKAVAFFFEGKLDFAFSHAAMTLMFAYIARSYARPKVIMLARVAFIYQVLTIAFLGETFDMAFLTRAILNRAFACIFFFDMLDETFIQMIILSWVVQSHSPAMADLPIRLFWYFLVPVYLFGVREWICSQPVLESARLQFFIALSIPALTVYFAFSKGADQPSDQSQILFMRVVGLLHALLGLVCWQMGRLVDQHVMGTWMVFYNVSNANHNNNDNKNIINNNNKSPVQKEQQAHGTTRSPAPLSSAPLFPGMASSDSQSSQCVDSISLNVEGTEPNGVSVVDAIFFSTAATSLILRSPYFVGIFAIAFVVARLLSMRFSILHKHWWRRIVLFLHGCVLMDLLIYHDPSELRARVALVALTTVRMLFAFEKRPYSKIQTETSIFCSCTSFLTMEPSLVGTLSFLSVANIAVTLAVSISREHAVRMLDSETKSQAFLSHAIKQKFSGVGSAVESLIHRTRKTKGNERLTQLLEEIFEECRKGEESCHALNMVRILKQNKHTLQTQYQSLASNLRKWWQETKSLTVGHLMFPNCVEDDPMMELEWELFRLVLCQWSRGAQILVVTCHEDEDDPAQSEIHFQFINPLVSASRSFDMLQPIAKHIPGLSIYRADVLVWRGWMTTTKSRAKQVNAGSSNPQQGNGASGASLTSAFLEASSSPRADNKSEFFEPAERTVDVQDQELSSNISRRESSLAPSDSNSGPLIEKLEFPPCGLRYAVLDDNTLVRRNIERIVRTHLKADGKSFARGETLVECHQFLQQIVDERVDIAIFDENLEFFDSPGAGQPRHLSGTELAIKARQIGFTGCAISHSARFSDEMKLAQAFDGFVEKTSSWKDFARGVANAWYNHEERLNRERHNHSRQATFQPHHHEKSLSSKIAKDDRGQQNGRSVASLTSSINKAPF